MENKILSISEYLDLINDRLKSLYAKVIGEVGRVDIYPSGHVYFSLRDKKDGSLINCAIWSSRYRIYGIKLEEGMKIISYGCPSVYKPSGKFSFIAETIELAGEGELKKKYEELKLKIEREGLFEKSRKRTIPTYIHKIGIVTSKQGAVISDFLSNIGRYGFNIKMIDSRVEGAEAIRDLLSSVKTFKKQDIEVLVIMRGGGSFESLQAFNNELLVREIASFPVPVIAAIGHDKDVPLVSLVADVEVSTPSIATVVLNESWRKAELDLEKHSNNVVNSFDSILRENKFLVSNLVNNIKASFRSLFQSISQNLEHIEKIIYASNPKRQFEMGYSVTRIGGKVIKDIKNVKVGESMNTMVFNGVINSEVKNTEEIK